MEGGSGLRKWELQVEGSDEQACTCMHRCVCVQVLIFVEGIRTYIYTHIYPYIYTYIVTYIHIYIYICIYTCIHT